MHASAHRFSSDHKAHGLHSNVCSGGKSAWGHCARKLHSLAAARASHGLAVLTHSIRNQIIKSVTQNRTPAIYPYRYFVADGGMLSYGVNSPDILRRSAEYISRIIKGEKPADLPVQVPVKFELFINRRAFQALGLTIPQTLLATADEVIE
jgi:hypothetical protein